MSITCDKGTKGTRISACSQITWDDIKGIVPIRKGWSKATANGLISFTYSEYVDKVKENIFFPIIGLDDYTDETPQNEENTTPMQVISETRIAKKVISMISYRDYNYHKAIWDKRAPNGGIWDYSLITSKGILFCASSDKTKITGFDGGVFLVESRKALSGSDKEQTMFKVQLMNPYEWNERAVLIPFSEIGDIDRYEGIQDVNLEIVGTPVVGDTTVNVKVSTSGYIESRILNVLDLDGSNFALTGTAANGFTSSVYNATQGYYSLTVPALTAGTLRVKLNDGTYDVGTDTLGQSYQGVSAEKTVA